MNVLSALLRRYAAGAWRRRWLAVAAAWIVCLIGWAGVIALPPSYEASAQIYVAADPVLTPLLKGIAIGGATESEVDLLRRTLLSRPNLVSLIDKTGLALTVDDQAQRDLLVRKLGKEIRITPNTNHLFTIAYRNANPELAFRIIQTMVNIFMERASASNMTDMANARRFLRGQIAYFHKRLQTTEKTRADFLSKYLQLLPGANGVSQFESVTAQAAQVQGELQDAIARRDMLQRQLKTTPPMLQSEQEGANGVSKPMVDKDLATAEQHLAELRVMYTDSYPGVVAAKKLVKQLKAEKNGMTPKQRQDSAAPAATISSVPNPLYGQLKVQLIDTETTISSLKRQLAVTTSQRDRLEALAHKQPGLQAEFINIDRNYSVLRKKYEELLGRQEEMRIGSAANIDANRVELQIVNPPQVPQNPVAPPRELLLAAVLVMGLGAGGGLAFLLAYSDGSFYTIQDLREIGLPVIGGISLVSAAHRRPSIVPLVAFGVTIVLLIAAFGGVVFGAKFGVSLASKIAARFA